MSDNERTDLKLALGAIAALAPRIIRALARADDRDAARPPTGQAAAWRNIADGCEIIADSARFLAERVTPTPPQD